MKIVVGTSEWLIVFISTLNFSRNLSSYYNMRSSIHLAMNDQLTGLCGKLEKLFVGSLAYGGFFGNN